jgi:Tfp pilus assembly PilM family ATPase
MTVKDKRDGDGNELSVICLKVISQYLCVVTEVNYDYYRLTDFRTGDKEMRSVRPSHQA